MLEFAITSDRIFLEDMRPGKCHEHYQTQEVLGPLDFVRERLCEKRKVGGWGEGGGDPERDGGEGEEERLFGGDSINRMCDFIHDQDFDQIGSLECL